MKKVYIIVCCGRNPLDKLYYCIDNIGSSWRNDPEKAEKYYAEVDALESMEKVAVEYRPHRMFQIEKYYIFNQ